MKRSFVCLGLAASFVMAAARAEDTQCRNTFGGACLEHLQFTWDAVPAPQQVRGVGATATTLPDGRVLVTGGHPGSASAEIFEPRTRSWVRVPDMHIGRDHHRAVLLHDGRVMVVGGDAQPAAYGNRGSAEIFSPETHSWTPAAPMLHERRVWRSDFAATRLADGRVLVTGGNNVDWGPVREAELFDPASGTWEAAGRLQWGRVAHTATPLRDGRVIVIGGYSDW